MYLLALLSKNTLVFFDVCCFSLIVSIIACISCSVGMMPTTFDLVLNVADGELNISRGCVTSKFEVGRSGFLKVKVVASCLSTYQEHENIRHRYLCSLCERAS